MQSSSINLILHLFHGFWGNPQDFSEFEIVIRKNLILNFNSSIVIKILSHGIYDYVSDFRADSESSDCFSSWTQAFVKSLEHNPSTKHVLIGYSLGGRLALNTYFSCPELFLGLITLSSHPGLEPHSPIEKETRYHSDLEWAKKFREKSWKDLSILWNNQEIFKTTQPDKKIKSLSTSEPDDHTLRSQLCYALINWSLSKQKYFLPDLNLTSHARWLFGEKDSKFKKIADSIQCSHEITSSGHRLLLDSPSEVAIYCSHVISEWIAEQ